MTPPILAEVQHISKIFDTDNHPIEVLRDISFSIREGEFLSIIGPSGSGKTTLLRVMGGLIPQTDGKIIFKNGHLKDFHKQCGFVFQDPTLLPWRTVKDNIRLPLEVAKKSIGSKEEEGIYSVITKVELTGFDHYYPDELSGGMRQRVSIARALTQNPIVLLMDEPFGALDEITRGKMNFELLKIWKDTGKTIIFVTHSIPEAVLLSDRIIVMSPRPGQIKEILEVDLPQERTPEVLQTDQFEKQVLKVRKSLDNETHLEQCHYSKETKIEPSKLNKNSEENLPKPTISRINLYVLYILVFLIILGIWKAIIILFSVPSFLLPSPEEVFTEYLYLLKSGSLIKHTDVTILEIISGFILGTIIGIVCGYALGKSPRMEKILSPYIVAAQSAPKIALAPLIVIWLGFGMESKVLLVALIVFFPIFVNMITGIRSVNRNYLELMKSTGAGRLDIFTKIEIPSSLPMLFAGLKTGITLAVIGAVVGEFVGANAGLGYLTIYAAGLMNTPMLFVAILQLTLLGVVLYTLISWIERRIMPWDHSKGE